MPHLSVCWLMVAAVALASCRKGSLEADIRALLDTHPEATVAVSVRSSSVSLDINADHAMHAASTMKIPVMIELFRRDRNGTLALDSTVEVRNSFRSIVDGEAYSISDDSDTDIYSMLDSRLSLFALMQRMMTMSSNLATNLLIDVLTADSVRQTAASLGAPTLHVLRGVEDIKAFEQGLSNTTTSTDLAALLLRLMEGTAVSKEADSTMIDVMSGNIFSTMIPSGLPPDARVVNKTGLITNVQHDAAIIYPASQRPYVLVILTQGIADEKSSAALGAAIARVIHAAVSETISSRDRRQRWLPTPLSGYVSPVVKSELVKRGLMTLIFAQ